MKKVLALAQRLYADIRVAYVFVDTDPEVASERLQERVAVAGRPQRLDPAERRRVLRLSKEFFDAVYEEMVRSSVPVLRIDGHMATEEQVERVLEWLGLGQESVGGAESRPVQQAAHASTRLGPPVVHVGSS
jgi:hypothetical protein